MKIGDAKPYELRVARLALVFQLNVPVAVQSIRAWGVRSHDLFSSWHGPSILAGNHVPLAQNVADPRVEFIALVGLSPAELKDLHDVLSCARVNLCSNGVIAGVLPYGLGVRNWTNLPWLRRHWHALFQLHSPLTVRGLHRQLLSAGFAHIEISFLEPSLDDPQLLTPVQHFEPGWRGWPAYATFNGVLRHLLLVCGLGSLLQRSVFFRASLP